MVQIAAEWLIVPKCLKQRARWQPQPLGICEIWIFPGICWRLWPVDLYILVVCGRANLNLIKSAAEPQELRGHVMTTDFVKLVLTSAGSQSSAHCIKQRWHLLSKDTNNPWTGFGREHVPALFETASPATADFAHLPSIYFVFVNNDDDPRAVWMSRRHLTGILSRWGAASLCSACQWGVLPSTCDCGKKQGHSCRLKKEKGTQSCIL